MLQTLKNLAPTEAEKVLVVLTEHLLPRPFDDNYSYTIDPALYSSALKEVKLKAKVRDGDNSQKAQTRMLSVLSNEMSNLILKPGWEKKAKERLSKKGDLPLTSYTLSFVPDFSNHKALGTTESHVRQAFVSPNQVYENGIFGESMLFFTSKEIYGSTENNFFLLTIAYKDKTKLVVMSAWRIYFSDLGLSEFKSIPDILNLFLNRYGLLIRSSGSSSQWTKIIVDDVSNIINGNVVEIEKTGDGNMFNLVSYNRGTSVFGVIRILFACAVNVTKYSKDLINHGVLIKEIQV